MIISHKYKFIFIKLRKTAGTSMEIALSGICGQDDIITPISNNDEEVKLNLGYPGAQNFEVPKKIYKPEDWLKLIFNGKHLLFYNHMPANEIRRLIPENIWKNYYKFCFERNPWDKTISHYYHRRRAGNYKSILDYLKNDTGDAIQGYDMYTDNSEVLVDKIYRYEELDSGLQAISKIIGLDEHLQMPEYRAKSQFREGTDNYQDILTKEEAGLIAKKYHREIKLMNYQY
jgi:hypothetical protein